ncbi:amino acid adenylation domain-containing protein [Methylocystis sp.]|uniref:amino acid adenylation domain-containing protein n=1 Tax=Methylocystis sp. TaxID=1911079 RepID=UPI003DA5316F
MPGDGQTTASFQATSEQGRIWRAELLSSDSRINHLGMLIEFRGTINIDALSRALNLIVDRHPLLRSTFSATDDDLHCVIRGRSTDVLAISQSTFGNRNGLDEFCEHHMAELFDLQAGPLYRAVLGKVAPDHHALAFVVHHIVFDAFSSTIFFGELRETYAVMAAAKDLNMDQRPPDPSATIELISARDLARESKNEAYWRRKLDGAAMRTTLPSDRPRPRVLSQHTDSIAITLPLQAYAVLKSMATQRRLTLFSMLLGAHLITLSRYSDCDDFVIGSSMANRSHLHLRNQIGLFVRTLVIRHAVPHDQNVGNFLASIQRTLLESIDHSALPFDRVVEAAGARPDLSQHALFQTAVVWEEAEKIDLQLPDVEMHSREISSERSPYDLFIRAKETLDGLSLTAQFSIDLFDQATVKEFLETFANICCQLPGAYDKTICEIDLAEQQNYRSRIAPNITRTPWVEGETISGRFTRIARLVPNATAIIHGTKDISYRALSTKVDACARHLRDVGIGAGALIGLALPRGIELVAAVLGVMKAGAAYVFINPSHGAERISDIISDAGALAILTDKENEARIPADAFVIDVVTIAGFCGQTIESEELEDFAAPEAPAYVLCTSGTTGRAKGVMIAHDGIVGLADWQAGYFRVGEGSRISQLSSFEFDACVGELVMALLNRGTLCIIDHEDLASDKLADAVNRYMINVVVSVPSVLRHLDPDTIEHPDRLTVVSVGEACPIELARRWSAKCRFVNGYGPTEFSVYSHVYEVDASSIVDMLSTPIGTPIDNARAVLVDRHGRVVPRGGTGEIYLGGRGLAIGYCGGDQADQFPKDSFCRQMVTASFSDEALQEAAAALSDFHACHFEIETIPTAAATFSMLHDIKITCRGLGSELRENASRVIAAIETDASSIESFARYGVEGLHGIYRSCGLTPLLLREMLGLRHIVGSVGADFGCGNGDCLDTLRELGTSAIGLDFSPSFVQKLRKRGLDARLSRIDCSPAQFAEESGIADRSLDFALATLVLDRVARPKQLLRNMLSSLRNDGVIAIQTPLPVRPIGEGPYAGISYTAEEHRLAGAENPEAARADLVQHLAQLGVVDVVIRPLEMAVMSLDGSRSYQIWSIAGRKQSVAERLQRQYRTGDLGRLRTDGNLEFLGRIDRQVKIRGQRVEIAGIEEVLRQHPKVLDAAVVTSSGPGAGSAIVAYVIPVPHENLDPHAFGAELAAHARQRLSPVEVPSRFVSLDTFPVNASGKLAYEQLLNSELGSKPSSDPPRAGVETIIADVWRDVLRVERCGRDDNIFDLGADSILIVQIVSRLAVRGVICTVNDVFLHQTVADLAVAVGKTSPGKLVSGGKTPRSGPLSPAQRWSLESDVNGTRVAAFAIIISVHGSLNAEVLRAAVKSVVAQHAVLRSSCRLRDNVWKLDVEASADPAFRVDILGRSRSVRGHLPRKMASAWIEQAKWGLKIHSGPRLLIAVAPSDAQNEELIILVHHFVTDIVSLAILIEDLRSAYNCQLRGQRWVGAQAGSFLGWTNDVLTHVESSTFASDAVSWAKIEHRCQSLPPHAVAASARSRGIVTRVVTAELAETFRQVAAGTGRRDAAAELLAAAFANAFSTWSGDKTVAVFLETHGRDEVPGGSPLGRAIGWFASFYPLVIEGELDAPAELWLERTRSAFDALPAWRQGYLAWRQASDDRPLHKTLPTPSILLNFLAGFGNASDSQAPWRVLDVRRVEDEASSREAFDLELNVWSKSGELHFSLAWDLSILDKADASSLVTDASNTLIALLGAGSIELPVHSGSGPGVGAEKPVGASPSVPLSALQQGMLFHGLLEPGSGVYVNQISMAASSVFDPNHFAAAFSDVAAAHEALRSCFAWEGVSEPVQIVEQKIEIPMVVEDWSELSPATLHERTRQFSIDDLSRGFDLARPPLMRLHAARLFNNCWHLTWTFHHALIDGWSVGIVLGDLLQTYSTRVEGKSNIVPTSPRLFDVVAAVRQPDRLEALAFWRERLGTIDTPVLLLGRAMAPRSSEQSGYAELVERLDRATAESLVNWARKRRLTVNTVVEGVYAVLLSRYADSAKAIFGVTVSVRRPDVPDIDRMVGLLINTIPRVYDVPDSGSFVSFLAGVQAEVRACEPWAATPLAVAQEASGVAKGCALFDSILMFENYALPDRLLDRFAELGLKEASFVQQSNYPLNMVCVPRDGLALHLSFDQSRVRDEFAIQFLRHFVRILRAVAGREDWQIDDLPMLGPNDLEAALVRGEQRAWPVNADTTLHRLFADQATRAPARVAIIDQLGVVTYAQLARQASRVGALLQIQGIAQEERVGICVDRSRLMYAGLLGILMAGAAFVPLDPRHPRDRIARLATHAGVRFIIVDEAHAADVSGLPFVVLSLEGIVHDEALEITYSETAGADNLAYVMFSSGSTGNPKQVLGTHRATLNCMFWRWEVYPFADGEIACQKTALAFGDSIQEIFGPLLAGITTVVIPDALARNPEVLVDRLSDHAVTRIVLVPSLLREILRLPNLTARLPKLKLWISSGEALSTDLIAAFHGQLPSALLVNLYGTSEISCDVTWAEFPAHKKVDDGPVSIGLPIPNMAVAVLDSRMRLVPEHVPGFLYVGGQGLSRGYLGRPDLTAAAFVPDAFGVSEELGERLYRTGDIVIYDRRDGLRFVGRQDQQVKLRGERIELEEIAETLRGHEKIESAFVTTREHESGDITLVAFIVPVKHQRAQLSSTDRGLVGGSVLLRGVPVTTDAKGPKPEPNVATGPAGVQDEADGSNNLSEEALRAFLAKRLPRVMIPTYFFVLSELPRTLSGKIDQQRLAALLIEAPPPFAKPLSPKGTIEQCIVMAWSHILGRQIPDRNTNFFDVGGHSLLLVRVRDRLAAELNMPISLQDLYRHPTVADLALHLSTGQTADPSADGPPTRKRNRIRRDRGTVAGQLCRDLDGRSN